ncbi:MAG: dihydroorotase [Bdellovibrionaceae bacterium]|nr:dihydroorotase [Pseudobdellovibrionaceae bacterium]
MNFDLLIKNATTFVPENTTDLGKRSPLKKTQLDIGIRGGRIVDLGQLSSSNAEQVLDANHLVVLPGIIDSQVHFREPGLTHKEDIESGTRGALLGGITGIFEMPNTKPSTTTVDLFKQKVTIAKNRSHTHFAFYAGAAADNVELLNELENQEFCSGIKVFMGSSTGTLLIEDDVLLEKVLKNAKRRVAVHCEDEFRLRERKSLLIPSSDGKIPVSLHPKWRDEITSLNAVKRLIYIAEKFQKKVHVLHVTCQEEVEFLASYKNLASVEVLPQHLTLHAPDCYEKWGCKAQQNPPIREKKHQEALWKALHNGVIDVIGSDHAPHTLEEKSKDYPNTPSGMTGVQTLLPVMLNHVNQGNLSLQKLTELLTENVRDVFQLKNKGRVQIGFDADFTLIDLNKERLIQNSWIASKSQWTIFDGLKVKGWPTHTILKGKICMQDDEILNPFCGNGFEFERN